MKRAGNLMGRIVEMENLELAFWKAAKGKSGKPEAVAYRACLRENLTQLREQLLSGNVLVGENTFFPITRPKPRIICAPCFRERVLHHALMNVCGPRMDAWLIDDTFACRLGRGQLAALERAAFFAHAHGWYLKLDAVKYFDSIDHSILIQLLHRLFKDKLVLGIFEKIIRSYSSHGAKGLPIGNLTSQYFANAYLGILDRFVKETLKVRGYVRYMDDFMLWGNDRQTLAEWNEKLNIFASDTLKLTLKPPVLNRVGCGVPFLGTHLFADGWKPGAKQRHAFRKKLQRMEEEFLAGQLSEDELQQKARSLVAADNLKGGAPARKSWLATTQFRAETMDHVEAGSNRVLRGGAWNNSSSNCRVANRNNNTPSNTNTNNGFRCVRSSEMSLYKENDSDPVTVLPPHMLSAGQSVHAAPVLVGNCRATPNALGRIFYPATVTRNEGNVERLRRQFPAHQAARTKAASSCRTPNGASPAKNLQNGALFGES